MKCRCDSRFTSRAPIQNGPHLVIRKTDRPDHRSNGIEIVTRTARARCWTAGRQPTPRPWAAGRGRDPFDRSNLPAIRINTRIPVGSGGMGRSTNCRDARPREFLVRVRQGPRIKYIPRSCLSFGPSSASRNKDETNECAAVWFTRLEDGPESLAVLGEWFSSSVLNLVENR